MRLRNLLAAMALVLVCALLAGCGGSSRLSRGAYRARLATIAKEADKAQSDVEKGLRAKSMVELEARLRAFATAEDRLGDEVSALKPPKDAEAANSELARGGHDTATAVRAVLPKLAKFTSPKSAISFLTKLGNAKGGHEVDDALSQLKKLGYTKGS
jgi:nucleoid-associated protein YgaU